MLVFDLGMNDGTDSEYYLSKGAKVVGVDANPVSCDQVRFKLSDAVKDGRLIVVHAAIARDCNPIGFFKCHKNDHWCSIDKVWASRDGSTVDYITIAGTTVDHLIEAYGKPEYIKCDIEDAEYIVIEQLTKYGWKPNYISVEDCYRGPEYIKSLQAIGYNRFQLVEQSQFPRGSSGPMGSELNLGGWLAPGDFLYCYHTVVREVSGKRIAPHHQWFDIHATVSS